jgi:hypothetical protein
MTIAVALPGQGAVVRDAIRGCPTAWASLLTAQSHRSPFRHQKGMSRFHTGEIEVQLRLDVRDDADRVGRIIASEIPRGLAPVLATQRLAVAASLDVQRRPWPFLLTGSSGFIEAVDERLLRLAVSPGLNEALVANLRAHPDLGLTDLLP